MSETNNLVNFALSQKKCCQVLTQFGNEGSVDPKNSLGVEIEFSHTPFQSRRTHPPCLQEKDMTLVRKERSEMLTKQEIRPSQDGFYSNIFLVPKKDGKLRPVISLSALQDQETQRLAHKSRPEGCTTPMAEAHQKLLRFSIQNRHYQFTCLPFGLSSGPWVFYHYIAVFRIFMVILTILYSGPAVSIN